MIVLHHGTVPNMEFPNSITARQHLACAFFPEASDPPSLPPSIRIVFIYPLECCFLAKKPSEFTEMKALDRSPKILQDSSEM